jgi:hypothetical protein
VAGQVLAVDRRAHWAEGLKKRYAGRRQHSEGFGVGMSGCSGCCDVTRGGTSTSDSTRLLRHAK